MFSYTKKQDRQHCKDKCHDLEAGQLQREVLGDKFSVVEDNHQIDLELDFEVGGAQGWAGEQAGENHVNGDRYTAQHVSVSNLNILNFSHFKTKQKTNFFNIVFHIIL